ncbi:MAG: type II secretion system protein [Oscillospiraceae bacterium]|nr:type II secretion system protein [Oscillospiraceae bacterium]
MTRKFKAFTLIELIVAIAIFGIIMVGIMNLAQPITTSSATAKVANNQKNVEEATVSYIGENVRYATNLVVIEDGAKVGGTAVSSVKGAVDAFYKFSPVDVYGRLIDDNADNRKNISVIVWDGRNGKYSYVNHNYTGRLLAKTAGENPDSASLDSVDNYSATSNMYEVFGNDYYGPSNVYMNVSMSTGGLLKLECYSQYFKSNAAKAGADLWTGYDNGSGSVSGNATVGTFELRNMGKGDFRFYICGNDANTTNKIAASPTATGQVIYFVFTEELDALSIASTAPAAAPTYKDLAYDFGAGASNYVESKANSGSGGTNSGSGSSETGSGSGGTPSGGTPSGGTPSGGGSGQQSEETKTSESQTEAPESQTEPTEPQTQPTQPQTQAATAGPASATNGYVNTGSGQNGVNSMTYADNGTLNLTLVGNNGNNLGSVKLYKLPNGSYMFGGYTNGDQSWMLSEVMGNVGSELSTAQINLLNSKYGLKLDTSADSSLPGVTASTASGTGVSAVDKDNHAWQVTPASNGDVTMQIYWRDNIGDGSNPGATAGASMTKYPDGYYYVNLTGATYLFGNTGSNITNSGVYSEADVKKFAETYGLTIS